MGKWNSTGSSRPKSDSFLKVSETNSPLDYELISETPTKKKGSISTKFLCGLSETNPTGVFRFVWVYTRPSLEFHIEIKMVSSGVQQFRWTLKHRLQRVKKIVSRCAAIYNKDRFRWIFRWRRFSNPSGTPTLE